MTKADLIEEVSRVVEMTRKESEVIVEAIFDSIVRSLRTGDKIEIRGFGSFRTRQRQPRVGAEPPSVPLATSITATRLLTRSVLYWSRTGIRTWGGCNDPVSRRAGGMVDRVSRKRQGRLGHPVPVLSR